MAELIELIEGEKPFIVHSNVANSEARIAAFRNSDKRWIVSVGMISEGVDIPRLGCFFIFLTPELSSHSDKLWGVWCETLKRTKILGPTL